MSGYGPISLVFGLIIGVAYLVIQMNIASNVNEVLQSQFAPMEYRNETTDAVEAVAEAKSYEVFDARGNKASARKLAPLLTPDRFSDKRMAGFSTYVDPQSLLKEGETMPEGEMRDLMVEARAIRLADAACARLIETLAAECGVRVFEVNRIGPVEDWMDEERAARQAAFTGQYLLNTSVVFTPKMAVGTLPDSSRVTFHERRFDLETWTTDTPSAEAVAARTDEILAAAVRACADIREVHGNCTVIDVGIDADRRAAGAFGGSFELAWLTPLQGEPLPVEAVGGAEEGAPETAPESAPESAPGGATPLENAGPEDEARAPITPPDPLVTPEPVTPAAPAAPAGAPPPALNGGKAGKWVSP